MLGLLALAASILCVLGITASFVGPYALLGWAVWDHRVIMIAIAVVLAKGLPTLAGKVLQPLDPTRWKRVRAVVPEGTESPPAPRKPPPVDRRAWWYLRLFWSLPTLAFVSLWWHLTSVFLAALVTSVCLVVSWTFASPRWMRSRTDRA